MVTAAGEALAVRSALGRLIVEPGTVLDTVVGTPVEVGEVVTPMSAAESGGREGLGRCRVGIGDG